jgi:hypothetical protein
MASQNEIIGRLANGDATPFMGASAAASSLLRSGGAPALQMTATSLALHCMPLVPCGALRLPIHAL